MPRIENDRLLSRLEVEECFGIPKRFLETCVARGDGPPIVRIGRLARYRRKDIIDWIGENTKATQGGGHNV